MKMKKLMIICAMAAISTAAMAANTVPYADEYCSSAKAGKDCNYIATKEYCESVNYTDKTRCFDPNQNFTQELCDSYPTALGKEICQEFLKFGEETDAETIAYCKEVYWEDWDNCNEYREYCDSINYDGDDAICGGDTYND